jgi:hypothetical protein
MPYFPAANNDDPLEKLLAEMFPDVVLSRAGVALLADRISDLNKWSAMTHHRIDPKRPRRRRGGGAAAMPQRRFS